MSKLRLIINPDPPDNSDSRSIERGGPVDAIPTLREPTAGNPQVTWLAMCRLRGQLDDIKAGWDENTQPIERCWYVVWSKQLDETMAIFLEQHPSLKPKLGGGER